MFSIEDYVLGLRILSKRLTKVQIKMLQIHYFSSHRSVTPRQISNAMGWANGHATNLQYGALGKLLAQAIGKNQALWIDGIAHPVRVLAEFKGAALVHWQMWGNLAAALEIVGIIDASDNIVFADEVSETDNFVEGATRTVQVNLYERNPMARKVCIQHYGTICQICRFDFMDVYGAAMDGFIHVHHLKPLSEIGEIYQVDPIKDLIPVCPNCHAVVHSRCPAYSPDEVRVMLRTGVSR